MGSLYLPVKISLMVILALGLVLSIKTLAPELNRNRSNNYPFVVQLVIQIVVLIIGLIGSFKDNRQYLLIYSVAIMVMIVMAVIQSQAIEIVGNAVVDLLSIFLALWQGEMIRTGQT